MILVYSRTDIIPVRFYIRSNYPTFFIIPVYVELRGAYFEGNFRPAEAATVPPNKNLGGTSRLVPPARAPRPAC